MHKTGRLELTWVGKYDEPAVEPRILLEDKVKSYGDPESENMLIHGDNLIALKALEQDFEGKIKCIYIDPPYNTGSAFQQYDDSVEHSIWLSLMKNRLQILKNLLSEDGTIWISIDDDEQAYLKVVCDEVFGRTNFVANVIWVKKFSPQNDAKWLSDSHDFVLVYAKNKDIWRPNLLPRTANMDSRYKNPDNDPRGPWTSSDFTARTYSASTDYPITTPSGRVVSPTKSRSWISSKEEFERLVADNRIWFGAKGNNVPRKKTFLSEVQGGVVPMTTWMYDDVGSTQDAKKEVKALMPDDPFATPKPEKLIERILLLATKPGDFVLDSFLGSGTTAAVAHKMKRKWIGVELGEHCLTHCKKRIDDVIKGEQGGISKEVNWQGGGGYHFYELAPSLLVKSDKLPVYQINPAYTFEMLCEAICKIEGFRYKPQDVFHGHSSEKRFIHITTEFINAGYIKSLSARLTEDQSLLIYGTKIQSDMVLPDNIEVKKIPKDLLEKCDFESEVR
ncbi:MAG: site-specific DNA-methyltransferase [Aeriscardovia sp.]|nr:site-specific DNA-methyltransferase [Aeriscardovia sp.]